MEPASCSLINKLHEAFILYKAVECWDQEWVELHLYSAMRSHDTHKDSITFVTSRDFGGELATRCTNKTTWHVQTFLQVRLFSLQYVHRGLL